MKLLMYVSRMNVLCVMHTLLPPVRSKKPVTQFGNSQLDFRVFCLTAAHLFPVGLFTWTHSIFAEVHAWTANKCMFCGVLDIDPPDTKLRMVIQTTLEAAHVGADHRFEQRRAFFFTEGTPSWHTLFAENRLYLCQMSIVVSGKLSLPLKYWQANLWNLRQVFGLPSKHVS